MFAARDRLLAARAAGLLAFRVSLYAADCVSLSCVCVEARKSSCAHDKGKRGRGAKVGGAGGVLRAARKGSGADGMGGNGCAHCGESSLAQSLCPRGCWCARQGVEAEGREEVVVAKASVRGREAGRLESAAGELHTAWDDGRGGRDPDAHEASCDSLVASCRFPSACDEMRCFGVLHSFLVRYKCRAFRTRGFLEKGRSCFEFLS